MSDWCDFPCMLSFAEHSGANAYNDRTSARRFVERHLSKHHVCPKKGMFGFSCVLINDDPHEESDGAGGTVITGKNLRNENAAWTPVLTYDLDEGQTYVPFVCRNLNNI